MKKMLAVMLLGAGMQNTYAVFTDEAPDTQSDCATPTEFVIGALSASAIAKSEGQESQDWIDQLQQGASFTTNMVGREKRTEGIEGGVTAAQYADHERMLLAGDNLGNGRHIARFDVETSSDNTRVTIRSEIDIVEVMHIQHDEDWAKVKAEVEGSGSHHNENAADACTACAYQLRVALDEARKECRLYVHANCVSKIDKDDLVAKVKAERADVERVRAISESFKKSQDQN